MSEASYGWCMSWRMSQENVSLVSPCAPQMDAISACVVGGVSAYGGSGSVLGMVVGATLIGVINLVTMLSIILSNFIHFIDESTILPTSTYFPTPSL